MLVLKQLILFFKKKRRTFKIKVQNKCNQLKGKQHVLRDMMLCPRSNVRTFTIDQKNNIKRERETPAYREKLQLTDRANYLIVDTFYPVPYIKKTSGKLTHPGGKIINQSCTTGFI